MNMDRPAGIPAWKICYEIRVTVIIGGLDPTAESELLRCRIVAVAKRADRRTVNAGPVRMPDVDRNTGHRRTGIDIHDAEYQFCIKALLAFAHVAADKVCGIIAW